MATTVTHKPRWARRPDNSKPRRLDWTQARLLKAIADERYRELSSSTQQPEQRGGN